MARDIHKVAWGFVKRYASGIRRLAEPILERRVIVAFVFLGVLHLFIAMASTGSEWIYGHQGWAGARRSLNAKNYLRYGYVESRLGPLDNLGATQTKEGKPVRRKIYWHHPAGLSLIISAVFALFGESPAAARILLTLMSMLSFVLLLLIFRKFLGNWLTFAALLFLTFIPLYAAYLNFVNFEIFVVLCALGAVWLYEVYRVKRPWWMIPLIGLAVLVGCFSEYPIFPFYFFLWIVIIVAELRDGWRNWKLPLLFPLFVLAGGALLVLSIKFMNEWTWEQFLKSLERLFLHRHTLKTESPHLLVLNKWEFYYRFFNPIVMGLTAYWLIDGAARAFLKKLTRADAYVFVLFLLAFTYWYLLPQAAKIHEYVALYFSLPFAFAAAMGLWHLSASIAHGSPAMKAFWRVTVTAAFIITSVPIIWSIRVFPTYKIVAPVHTMDSPREFNYFISYNILARFVRDHSAPYEKIAFFRDFDIRPELWYYLDREHRAIPKRRELLSTAKRSSYAYVLINRNTVGVDLLAYLVKKKNFVYHDHYYAFDLGKHLDSITFLKKEPQERCALSRYFLSLPHPPYKVIEDKWKAVDLTLKLRGEAEALRIEKSLKPPPGTSLSGAVARYNLKFAKGENPDVAGVQSMLDKKSDRVFAGAVEYLGSRTEKKGGISVLTLLFRPRRVIDSDLMVRIKAEPLHGNEDLRDEIGVRVREMRFVVPSSLWKPGYVYEARDELLLFPGPYDLSFELVQTVTYQVINDTGDDNLFTASCKSIPPNFPEGPDQVTSRILGITWPLPQAPAKVMGEIKTMNASKFLIQKDLGGDMTLLGCLALSSGGPEGTARFFFYNDDLEGRKLGLTIEAKGPGLKSPHKNSLDLGTLKGERGRGRIFMIEQKLGADPSKLKISLLFASPGVPSPLPSKEGPTVALGKGDYGVHLPMQWLYWYGKIH